MASLAAQVNLSSKDKKSAQDQQDQQDQQDENQDSRLSSLLEKAEFYSDVIKGLSAIPKSLPCKYFYDAAGSTLFEQICDLDEYYVTRTEIQLLKNYGGEISKYLGENLTIVEPGAGAAKKVQILMRQLDSVRRFVPLEISKSALAFSISSVRQNFPSLELCALQGDFTNSDDLQALSQEIESNKNNLVFFPGSTIGNFERLEAISVLNNLRTLVGSDGYLLVGVDLIKSRKTLIQAYDDKKGVTAEFNKNLLIRINRNLDAGFDVENGFDHVALYSEKHDRIEMHLKSNRVQRVKVGQEEIVFNKDEMIHTENSHKYSVESFSSLAAEAGLIVVENWVDEREYFSLFLLRSAKA